MAKSIIYPKSERLGAISRDGTIQLILRRDTQSFQITGTYEGKRYRIGCGIDLKYAKQKFIDFVSELHSGLKPGRRIEDTPWQTIAETTHRRQKNAAKGRGIPFALTAEHVYQLMAETGFRCAVSGIMFSKPALDRIEVDPWAPSIDRIDNREGYMPGNVRVVTAAANYAMNRWGYDMLLRLANGVVRSSKIVAPEPVDYEYETSSRGVGEIDDTPLVCEILELIQRDSDETPVQGT